jgi:uroporphyrinogen-III synthase
MTGARGVLVTRPEPGAGETAARLRAAGWTPVLAPVLTIEPRTLAAPRRVQAVLATSGNAIPSLPARLQRVPLLAVGDATAARAVAAGFADVRSAGSDAAALLSLTCAACNPVGAPLLLASGEGQGLPLLRELRGAGFRVVRRVAYATRPAQALPPDALAALRSGEIAAVLVFSPASGKRILAQLRTAGIDVRAIDAFAISDAAAATLFRLPWRAIRVASAPNQDALLGLLP